MGIGDFGGNDESGVIFRDVVTLALVGIVALVVILLLHINPPGDHSNADVVPPGNVIIEISWASELDTDIDLWVQAPGDVPVGYSNKGGQIFNLLRDDLGRSGDPTNVNLESAYSRGIVPGEYTVNVHLYRNKSQDLPLPIEVIVVARVKPDADSSAKNLISRTIKLDRIGREITAFRFRLTAEGALVEGSVNTINRPLRSA